MMPQVEDEEEERPKYGVSSGTLRRTSDRVCSSNSMFVNIQRHGWMLVAVKILPKLKSRIKDTTTMPRPVMQATRQQQNGRECR
jgi:hypothetical protein